MNQMNNEEEGCLVEISKGPIFMNENNNEPIFCTYCFSYVLLEDRSRNTWTGLVRANKTTCNNCEMWIQRKNIIQ